MLNPNPIDKDGWELTFNDEFDAGKIDEEKWKTIPYFGKRYHPIVQKDYFSDDSFEFTNSTIKILCTDERQTIYEGNSEFKIPFTTGLLDSSHSFEQKHGFFEIRCKIPNGPGFWPAFWLVSKHSYPPEIDILEAYTSRKRKYTLTQHWKKNDKHTFKSISGKLPFPDKFHTYACEWDEKQVKYFLDNIHIITIKNGVGNGHTEIGSVPMHITINNAAESKEWQGDIMKKATFPGIFEIDYVRTYKKKK